MTGYFGQHAERLAGYGYDVIPISRADDRICACPGKQPAQRRGWREGCLREHWPAYADCGLGILTKRTPAVDIDVKDQDIADAIQRVADRCWAMRQSVSEMHQSG